MRKIKIPTISPVLRITIGLLLLTVSLLMIGDLLEIVPNQKQSEVNARKTMAESLAIQISYEIGENRVNQAIDLLNNIVNRNKHVQSIGLRTNTNKIIMQSDEHKQLWIIREDDSSTDTHMQVPIYGQKGRWGTLEVSFTPLGSIWSNLFSSRSFTAMLLFIFIFGFITYWLFLKRVLSELDPSSVVPDRVRSALDVLTEGLVILDTNERIVLANTSLKKKLGLSDDELIGKQLSSLPWKGNNDTLAPNIQELPWNILLETNELPISTYLKLKTINHDIFSFDIHVSPIKAPNQKIKGVIVTIDDVTELEKKNSELNHILHRLEKSQNEIKRQNTELTKLATRDPLTNLLNRRSLFEGMHDLLTETRKQSNILSCIMLDIDHFKLVNDNYGHAIGDKVIQKIANILQESVSPNDLAGRYGGEEFVIVLPGLDESKAAEIAEKIRLIIFEVEHPELPNDLILSSSFGVTSTLDNTWQADKLVDHADQALYVAKQSGRNRVVCYSTKDMKQTTIKIPFKPSTNTHKTPSGRTLSDNNSDTSKSISALSTTFNQKKSIQEFDKTLQHTHKESESSSRTLLLDRLTQAQRFAQRNQTNLAVLTIFIDTIQLINNTMGYTSAEKLKQIAFERLQNIFRLSDSITAEVTSKNNISLSRSSDSEFTAILVDIKKATDITWAIFRMFKELSKAVEIDGNEIVMTANIGVSSYPVDGEDVEELLANSKMALYKAKEEGRGTFLFYNQEMHDLSKKILKIESQLHQALEREELYLNFQPIINMKTGNVEKVETLLRWNHPELGSVSPDTFIKIAEHAGSIKAIGKWVIVRSCRQLQVWQKNGYPHLTISINISAIQFNQVNLTEDIIDIVRKEGVSPESIIFELTETALFKKHNYMLEIISKLHEEGFKIALDDFGTGYSSLEYLQNFPIDWVKIDRSLMHNFPNDIHAVSIVTGLISLCHNLGIRVITEGVEHESQLLSLHDLECDEVQGYLISRPLSAEHITKFLESTKSRRMIRKINTAQSKQEHTSNKTSLSDILNIPPV